MTTATTNSDRILRKRFGAYLKEVREDIGLTQLDVALHLDYGYPATVSQVERGVSALPAADLLEWANILRVKHDEFAKKYLYYCDPHVYHCLTGQNPYDKEHLASSGKTVSPVRGAGRSPR